MILSVIYVALVGGIFYAKLVYQQLAPEQLSWLLWPTAKLASLLSGMVFISQGGVFISPDLAYTIDKSCSGYNFLLISLILVLYVSYTASPHRFSFLLMTVLAAYCLTIVANAFRITVSLAYPGEITAEMTHRVQGIAVYLLCLLGFYQGLKLLRRFSCQPQ